MWRFSIPDQPFETQTNPPTLPLQIKMSITYPQGHNTNHRYKKAGTKNQVLNVAPTCSNSHFSNSHTSSLSLKSTHAPTGTAICFLTGLLHHLPRPFVFHLGGRNAETQSHHHRAFLTVWFFNPSYFLPSFLLSFALIAFSNPSIWSVGYCWIEDLIRVSLFRHGSWA